MQTTPIFRMPVTPAARQAVAAGLVPSVRRTPLTGPSNAADCCRIAAADRFHYDRQPNESLQTSEAECRRKTAPSDWRSTDRRTQPPARLDRLRFGRPIRSSYSCSSGTRHCSWFFAVALRAIPWHRADSCRSARAGGCIRAGTPRDRAAFPRGACRCG